METSTSILSSEHTYNTTENTGHYTDSTDSGHYEESLGITIWYGLSGILICVLNVICAAAIFRGQLHKEENKFLFMASLAVADSMLGSAMLLSAIMELATDNMVVCYLSSILREVTSIADMFCLCLLTADQFMRIELHMKYPVYATFRNAYCAIAGVIIVCSAHVVFASLVWYYSAENHCNYLSLPRWYHIYGNIAFFCVPLLVIVSMHIRIVYISWTQWKKLAVLAPTLQTRKTENHASPHSCHTNRNHRIKCETTSGSQNLDTSIASNVQINSPTSLQKNQHNQVSDGKAVCPCGHNDTHQAKKQWKAVITITVLVGLLLCSWVPPHVLINVVVFDQEWTTQPAAVRQMLELISNLYVINPLLNPFIYMARVPEVKRQIRKMMTCSCRLH